MVQGLLTNQLEECTSLQELEILIENKGFSPEERSLILEHLVYKSLDLVCPDDEKVKQFNFIKSVIRDIAPFDYGDQDQLKCAVGGEVAKLVGQVKKSKECIHLLSILCGHMRKNDAQKLIGRSISNTQYAAARLHRRYPGPGVPCEGETGIAHQRRIKEKTIEEFVEWLNAVGLLQNLAFGEKIVKVSNGFHVAIESVKRTQSIQNIIRYYYRQFMGKRQICDDDDDNSESGNEFDDDVLPLPDLLDHYSDDDDDEDDGDDCDNNEVG